MDYISFEEVLFTQSKVLKKWPKWKFKSFNSSVSALPTCKFPILSLEFQTRTFPSPIPLPCSFLSPFFTLSRPLLKICSLASFKFTQWVSNLPLVFKLEYECKVYFLFFHITSLGASTPISRPGKSLGPSTIHGWHLSTSAFIYLLPDVYFKISACSHLNVFTWVAYSFSIQPQHFTTSAAVTTTSFSHCPRGRRGLLVPLTNNTVTNLSYTENLLMECPAIIYFFGPHALN